MMVSKTKISGTLVLILGLAGCSVKESRNVRGSDKEDVSGITTQIVTKDGQNYSTRLQSARTITVQDAVQFINLMDETPATKIKRVRAVYSCLLEESQERAEGEIQITGNLFPLANVLRKEWLKAPEIKNISCGITVFGITNIGSSIRDLVLDLKIATHEGAGLEIQNDKLPKDFLYPFVDRSERAITSITGLVSNSRTKLECLNTEYSEVETRDQSALTLEELDKDQVARNDFNRTLPSVDLCRVIQTNSDGRVLTWSKWMKVDSFELHPPATHDQVVRAIGSGGHKRIDFANVSIFNYSNSTKKYYAFKVSELIDRSVRFWEAQGLLGEFLWHPTAVKANVNVVSSDSSKATATTIEGEEIVYFEISPQSSLNLKLNVSSPVSNKCFRFIHRHRLGGVEINLSNAPLGIYAYNPKANVLGKQTHQLGPDTNGLVRSCWVNCNKDFKGDVVGPGSTKIKRKCRS